MYLFIFKNVTAKRKAGSNKIFHNPTEPNEKEDSRKIQREISKIIQEKRPYREINIQKVKLSKSYK